ncbi:hypothetical protein SMICM304S_01140 [Streptomyces microflavus]
MNPSAARSSTNAVSSAATVCGEPMNDCRVVVSMTVCRSESPLAAAISRQRATTANGYAVQGPALDEPGVDDGVDLGERPVRVVRGEVGAPELLGGEDRVLRGDLLTADLVRLLLRLGVGVADHHGDPGHDLEVVGLPPVRREPRLDVGVEDAARVQGAVPGEDDVGGGGGELPALAGVPGLDHHRVALRGARAR